ncbi:MAG: hypothetical protein A2341_13775 [Deltaproteobacteria bacterium RIFOXYB12_FULL_58_9]|nr:MAG: hypothetical protein A2341_13775 [Deltaproteobacteria bacterium RIFOXYB12_FULL_58_9]
MGESSRKQMGAGLWDYLKEAFFFRWNLLALAGVTVAAVMSPSPDILLPLVAAGELAYLAGLTSIPRFRSAIDAKRHAEKNASPKETPRGSQNNLKTLGAMFNGLSPASQQRFERLRERCASMQQIAHGVRGATGPGDSHADELREPALDKLLWAFLRLLFSQQALSRFLAATDEPALKTQLAALETRMTDAAQRSNERIVNSLRDSIITAKLRLDNYRSAQANAEFVSVELDRIEGKIQAISEMAVGHQDADYISSQVDSVADSMTHTEEAIRELNSITGLSSDMEAPPIMSTDLDRVVQ